MKKIFFILVFFVVAGGIFYVAENINPKNGVTIGELVQLVNGDVKTDEVEIENGLNGIKNEDMLAENKFSPFVDIGKSLQGKAKEIYDSIVVRNYNRDNMKFIKLASNLKSEELSRIYEILTESNIDKSSIIDNIQKAIGDKSLTKEQIDNLNQLISSIE